ncbi:MAG: oligosaccharide flippase family protein [Bryobacteraceae bacterium]
MSGAVKSGGIHIGRYVSNVAWSWAGVAVTVVVGFFLSPYTIHKVGDSEFGIWTLALAMVDYYWLIDLGFRSATLKYSAQYHAAGDETALNELLSTGLLYSAISGVILFGASFVLAPWIGARLHIQQPVFVPLIRLVGFSWAVGLVFNRYSACLEGFQRFDITSRVWILTTALRAISIALLLYFGFGIFQMGIALVACQFLGYFLNFAELQKLFPAQRAGWGNATVAMFQRMARYGFHSFTALISNRLLNQGVLLLLPYFLPVRFVTYYGVPWSLLDYAMDGVSRIGMVTAPSAAALEVQGSERSLLSLAVHANRYCLTIYLPVTVLLTIYGRPFFTLWLGSGRADYCAPLLAVLLIGSTAMAGQFNSVSVLTGLGLHKTYARSLFVEAVLCIGGLFLAVPRYGVMGAAAVVSALMFLNRGIVTAFLTARVLRIPTLQYLRRIYAVPCGVAGVSAALLLWCRWHWLPGRTWPELIAAGGIFAASYGPLAFFLCLSAHHRAFLVEKVRTSLARFGSSSLTG